jgi:hypothetical protein
MGTVIVTCSEPPSEEDDICKKLAKKINELINRDKHYCGDGGTHGLKHRFREQIEGKSGPGTEGWDIHDNTIKNQQRGLRNRLDDFNRNNCGSKVPLPEGAWNWATRPAPQASEWKGPQHKIQHDSDNTDFWDTMAKITGLTGAALVIYVIVSEGSRLFPPRNLVPVP